MPFLDFKKVACSSCGKLYKNAESLRSHRRYDCGKRKSYPGRYCCTTFKRKNDLQSHVIKKHNYILPPEYDVISNVDK